MVAGQRAELLVRDLSKSPIVGNVGQAVTFLPRLENLATEAFVVLVGTGVVVHNWVR